MPALLAFSAAASASLNSTNFGPVSAVEWTTFTAFGLAALAVVCNPVRTNRARVNFSSLVVVSLSAGEYSPRLDSST
ncbi:hypothetical protein D3C85_1826130 [compost metagenome]